MKVWREANQKPPLGAVINWTAPANDGLYVDLIHNEGCGAPCNMARMGLYTPADLTWTAGGLSWGITTSLLTMNEAMPGEATGWSYVWGMSVGDATRNGYLAVHSESNRRDVIVGYLDNNVELYFRGRASSAIPIPDTKTHIYAYSVVGTKADTGAGYSYRDGAAIGALASVDGSCGYSLLRIGHSGFYPNEITHFRAYCRAVRADEVAWDYVEPYGRDRYLVPGLARIFDMGGVPIGAIRTRFPALTGGLRI
jgi:hypothetical protein